MCMCYFDGKVRDLGPVPTPLLDALNGKLVDAVRRNDQFWQEQDAVKPNRFGVFRATTEHVVFGFPRSLEDHLAFSRYALWHDWRGFIEPIIEHVARAFPYARGQTNRIMLAKLLAGAVIQKHIDDDGASIHPHKIHVPLVTNADVEFWEDDERFHLEVGRAYELNNRIPHGGANRGTADRVHLIFDYFGLE